MLGSLLLTALSLTSLLPGAVAVPSGKGKGKGHGGHGDDGTCTPSVNKIECGGEKFVYEELAGVGLVPGNGRDKYHDTLAGLGSAAQVDLKSWKKKGDGYEGVLWSLPDRGWNTEGTLNFQPRVHKFKITFTPKPQATLAHPSSPNLEFKYLDTILLTDPNGKPCTGLDPTGVLAFSGLPDLPAATYVGDGFGTDTTSEGDTRVCIDSEGLVLNDDGSFWISDEYGPFVYLFDKNGKMLNAIKPPAALIPRRNGEESYSAASPPRYDPDHEVDPEEPETGRKNNRGFEGLGTSPDGKTLWVLLQSATNQEGGSSGSKRRYTRLLEYDVSNKMSPVYKSEHVVPLPGFTDKNDDDKTKYAAQSEMYTLPNGQFLMLARDSDAGSGLEFSESNFRKMAVFDISGATDVKGTYDDADSSFAPDGVLVDGVTPAEVCEWIDFNINEQLGRFGMHNGGADDDGLLNEKWESISILPVDVDDRGKHHKRDGKKSNEYYIISLSDNDFVTQNGAMNFGQLEYADESGHEINNQALVFKVKMPF